MFINENKSPQKPTYLQVKLSLLNYFYLVTETAVLLWLDPPTVKHLVTPYLWSLWLSPSIMMIVFSISLLSLVVSGLFASAARPRSSHTLFFVLSSSDVTDWRHAHLPFIVDVLPHRGSRGQHVTDELNALWFIRTGWYSDVKQCLAVLWSAWMLKALDMKGFRFDELYLRRRRSPEKWERIRMG